MIEKSIKDTTKKVVSLTDIFAATKRAKQENNTLMTKKLMNYFTSENTGDTVELEKNSDIYKYIKKDSNEIGLENIMVSYFRAWTDNNHEMKAKLKKILFEYISNKKEGIDNEYLLDIIEDDKLLRKYIEEVPTIEKYEEKIDEKSKGKTIKEISGCLKENEIDKPEEKKGNVYTFESPRGMSIAS